MLQRGEVWVNNARLRRGLPIRKAEAKALTDRAKASANKVANLKAYLAESMQTMDKKKINAGVDEDFIWTACR